MPKPLRPVIDRLLERVVVEGRGFTPPCWVFQGSDNGAGYCSISVRDDHDGRWRNKYVHRISYEHYKGRIGDGLQVDHLCRVRRCCNPEHLEVVTRLVNMRRGSAPNILSARLGFCKRGHDLSDAYIHPDKGYKDCRRCRRDRGRAFQSAVVAERKTALGLDRLVPRVEAASLMGVCPETVTRFKDRFASFPRPVMYGNRTYYDPDALLQWKKEHPELAWDRPTRTAS